MNHKYLISGGCSFSEASEYWGSSLVSNKNLFNTAKGGCGNEFIRRQVIFKVSELLKKGIPSNEILVGVQWTGLARIDLFVTKEETVTENEFKSDFRIANIGHETHPYGDRYLSVNSGSLEWNWKIDKHDYGWIHSGGGNDFVRKYKTRNFQDRFFQNYFKYFMTHDIGWSNFLYNVLIVQWFCKSNNISFFNFTGWNNIDNDDGDKYIENFMEKYSHSKHLWDMIDQNNFIFYESDVFNMTLNGNMIQEKSKYGGMWQYLAEHDGINWDNDHPSTKGHKIWGNFLKGELIKRKII